MIDMLDMPVKFFPKDVTSGEAKKPGDRFTAFFLNGDHEFEVMEEGFSPKCFFGKFVRDE